MGGYYNKEQGMDLIEPAAGIGYWRDFGLGKKLLLCSLIGILVHFFPWPIIEYMSFVEHSAALHGS